MIGQHIRWFALGIQKQFTLAVNHTQMEDFMTTGRSQILRYRIQRPDGQLPSQ